ncbi:hypothetical protein [Spongiactinospora sp. TRM90649]|nr:hypothetical protein [Spongiactinospora sp. TRM90649]MDF5756538.1 hypothetical protein [Spongiactinospora sp. TRM90649]
MLLLPWPGPVAEIAARHPAARIQVRDGDGPPPGGLRSVGC